MPSAREHLSVVQRYIEDELRSLLAKVDIEAAYQLVPVHPQDRQLQAVKRNDRVYVDPMLPFGLRSAPKIFNAIADALEWILHHQGVEFCEHYLDDFIILGRPDSPECQQALASLQCVRPAGSAASSPQERGSNHMHYVSRNRDRYGSMRAAATTRQAGLTDCRIGWPSPVESEQVRHVRKLDVAYKVK